MVNETINDVQEFQYSTLAGWSRSFFVLRDDVFAEILRSQATLRLSREALITAGTRFPYYRLNETVRPGLVMRLTTILGMCVEPTLKYLQIDSMSEFYNFMTDARTPVENAFEPASKILQNLVSTIRKSSDACLRKVNLTPRALTREFNQFINAGNDCIRNATTLYRSHENDFARAHVAALQLLTRLTAELVPCANGNSNQCVERYLKKYCEDETTCKVCLTM